MTLFPQMKNYKAPNPNNYSWGVVIVSKNNDKMMSGYNFKDQHQKVSALNKANSLVVYLIKLATGDGYQTQLIYGVSLNDYLSGNAEKI